MIFRQLLGRKSLVCLVCRLYFAVICNIFAPIAVKLVWKGYQIFCTVIVYMKMREMCDF